MHCVSSYAAIIALINWIHALLLNKESVNPVETKLSLAYTTLETF